MPPICRGFKQKFSSAHVSFDTSARLEPGQNFAAKLSIKNDVESPTWKVAFPLQLNGAVEHHKDENPEWFGYTVGP